MRRSLLRRPRSRRRSRRVLVAIPGGEYGGAERYAVRIAASAVQDGWEVAAAVRRQEALKSMEHDLHCSGVRVLQMVRGERLREFGGFLAMAVLYDPDVVHLTLPWPLAAGRLRAVCGLLGIPTVLVYQVVPEATKLPVRNAWLYRLSRRRRQHWVAVSAYGSAMLRQAFKLRPSDQITVIHNAPRPIRDNRNGAPAPRGEAAKRRAVQAVLGREGDAPVIVSVGRLAQEKGHDVLIGAAEHLTVDWPDLRVLIAGEGAARRDLQRMIDQADLHDRVRLLGQVEDVRELLRAADVFAFPSRREGTPFALLEAMTNAIPVVAADFGGADEIVDSGQNGVLVQQDDPVALARAIDGLLRDPERARVLGARGRDRAAKFSEPLMIGSTLALLDATARGSTEG